MKIWEQITPETWCKWSLGRDKHGRGAIFSGPDACSWCAEGWIFKTFNKEGNRIDAYDSMLRAVGADADLARWNDYPERTFEEVQAAFKKADL